MNIPYITKKPSLVSSHQHRALHSQKSTLFPQSELVQTKLNIKCNSQPNVPKADLKAFIEIIPSDQRLIEQYIEELKEKLQQIRCSPKKKASSRMETQQIFKRKYSQQSQTKSKAKSNDAYSRGKSIADSVSFQTAKKSALLDFKQARDDFKRSKQRLVDRRLATEKENHRYSEQKPIKTQTKNTQAVTQSCDMRIRSNTQVLRSQKNPARIYRYSSLKKAPCLEQSASVNNNYLFDKIISVHHSINIHLDQNSHSPKERLRREPNEETSEEKQGQRKNQTKSPKKNADKIKINENGEKIGDLSTINARKETLNFLGESCMAIKEQLVPKEEKEVSKILDFLGWKTNEMKKVLTNLKQKKRKNGFEKLCKIFPKGFFP